jgi:HK97 family phage portal protein
MIVLEEGMKFEPWSFSPRDAEFLQNRQVSNEDVARIFGVPPAVVGIGDRPTYGSAVEESRQLVARCIGPLAARVEAAMQRDLLSVSDRRDGFFLAHDLDGLLRGDSLSRFTAYRIAREIGVFSPNDIRRREGESPIAEGDSYIQPLNYAELGTQAPGREGGQ